MPNPIAAVKNVKPTVAVQVANSQAAEPTAKQGYGLGGIELPIRRLQPDLHFITRKRSTHQIGSAVAIDVSHTHDAACRCVVDLAHGKAAVKLCAPGAGGSGRGGVQTVARAAVMRTNRGCEQFNLVRRLLS